MRIRADLRFIHGEVKGLLYLADQFFAVGDALVGENGELARCRMVHHSATRELFVLGFMRHFTDALELRPHIDVASWMRQVLTIGFCFIKGRAIEDQLAVEEPKDADMRFTGDIAVVSSLLGIKAFAHRVTY